MKIRPVLKQRSVLSMAVALGSTLFTGCDQKLGGDVPMTPEMQKKWQEAEQNQPQWTAGTHPPADATPRIATPEPPVIDINPDKLPQPLGGAVSVEAPQED